MGLPQGSSSAVGDLNLCGIQLYKSVENWQNYILIAFRPSASPASAQSDDCIRLLVYTLERALQSFDRHAQPLVSSGVVFLVHLANYSNANQPPVDVALNFINIFQSIYAEQLAAAFLVDAPWYFEVSFFVFDGPAKPLV